MPELNVLEALGADGRNEGHERVFLDVCHRVVVQSLPERTRVCVRDREEKTERECVCERERERERATALRECVRERERERERL